MRPVTTPSERPDPLDTPIASKGSLIHARHPGVCDCCEREDVTVTTFADEFGTTLCDDCIKACEGQVSYGRE